MAKFYNMLSADEVGADGRTAVNNAIVCSVFVIGPDKKFKPLKPHLRSVKQPR